MGRQIVEASIVAAPRQRMANDENAIVEGGGIPADWQAKPRKLAHKDRDARRTMKRGRRKKRPDGSAMMQIAAPIFGDTSHINTDCRHGVVRRWSVTDAGRHDGRGLGGLPDRDHTGSEIWADTASRFRKNEKKIAGAGLVSKVHFRKPPGKALSAYHERANAARSKVRPSVEHPFAEKKSHMGLFVRAIAIDRPTVRIDRAKIDRAKIDRAKIASNMRRLVFREQKSAMAQRRRGKPQTGHQYSGGTEDQRTALVQNQAAKVRKTGCFRVSSFCSELRARGVSSQSAWIGGAPRPSDLAAGSPGKVTVGIGAGRDRTAIPGR
ncbi:MAG: hypothetical protein AAF501_00850 [Pseudomonadota bacterium]